MTYSLTVSVDMTNEGFNGDAMDVRLVGGSWNAMTDMGDGVWSYTFTGLTAGDYSYNFNDGWYESSSNLGECAGGNYGNDRTATIVDSDVVVDTVCWESCEACTLVCDSGSTAMSVTSDADITVLVDDTEVFSGSNGEFCVSEAPLFSSELCITISGTEGATWSMTAGDVEFYSSSLGGYGTFGCAVVGCRDNGEGIDALYPGIPACNYDPLATVDSGDCDWGASIANGYYTGYDCDGNWYCATLGNPDAGYTAYIPFVLDMYGDASTGWAGHSFQVVDWLDTQDGDASIIQGPFTFDASQPELTQVNDFNGMSYQTAMACLSSDLVTGCYVIQVGGGDDTVDPLWHLYGYQPVAGGPYVVDYSAGFSLEWVPTAGDAQGGGYIEGDSGGDQPGDDVVLGATDYDTGAGTWDTNGDGTGDGYDIGYGCPCLDPSAENYAFNGTGGDPDVPGEGWDEYDEGDVYYSFSGACWDPEGCTDPAACNYDPNAIDDDGSCDLTAAADQDAVVGLIGANESVAAFVSSISADAAITNCTSAIASIGVLVDDACATTVDDLASILALSAVGYADQASFGAALATDDGTLLAAFAAAQAGAMEGFVAQFNALGQSVNADYLEDMTIGHLCDCSCPGTPQLLLPGCTDESACNYDADAGATFDDGSCTYPASDDVDCDGNLLSCVNPDAASTDDNNAAVDAALGAFGVSTCPDLIGYVQFNYGYTLDDACAWDGTGSPFSFGGMTIADMCGCSCPAPATEPVEPECENTDNGASDSYGDTCASWYDANESPGSYGCSGAYDTADFIAAEMCCACGGGTDYVAPEPTVCSEEGACNVGEEGDCVFAAEGFDCDGNSLEPVEPECENTDNGASDSYGDTCASWYDANETPGSVDVVVHMIQQTL